MMKNNQKKKSIWGPKKLKMNLEQTVRTLEERNLLAKNIYPLVFVLNEEDLILFEEGIFDFSLKEYYRKLELSKKDSSVSYIALNPEKIEQSFFDGTIYLDSIKLSDGTERFVQNVCHSVNRTLTYIGVTSKRKLLVREGEIEFLSLQDLAKQAVYEYEKENRKRKVFSQQEIDEIHERGHLTPLEKAKEWSSMGLCAPGDYAGSAKNRCHQFGNCKDCLIDYAYGQDEHVSIYDYLKIVNIEKEETGDTFHSEEVSVKKIGTKDYKN